MTAQAFYAEVIEPHKETLAGMLEGINRIMELLERYGDCPSVVDTIADSEKKVERIGDILSKVHSGTNLQCRPHRPPASQGHIP